MTLPGEFTDVIDLLAEEVRGECDGGYAEDRGEAIESEEFPEWDAESARGEKRGRAQSREESRGEQCFSAVFVESGFRFGEALRAEVFIEQGQAWDVVAVASSEPINDAIGEDDRGECDGGHDPDVGQALIAKVSACDEGDVLGNGQTEPTCQQDNDDASVGEVGEEGLHGGRVGR